MELALFGGPKPLIEVADFLGVDRTKKGWEKNLKGRVTKPLLDMGLVEWENEADSTLRLTEGFENSLHSIFVDSGGQAALKRARDKFGEDREDHQRRGAEANDERSEQHIIDAILGKLDMESLGEQQRRVARDQSLNMMIVEMRRSSEGEEAAEILAKRKGYYHPTLNPAALPGKEATGR